MRRVEGGQALAGTLVVMMFAFLLAGAVAVAASALLAQKSGTQDASSRDLTVEDALAAAVAQVAGHGTGDGGGEGGVGGGEGGVGGGGRGGGGRGGGGSALCSSPGPLPTSRLPNGYYSVAFCTRIDNVRPSAGNPTFGAPLWSANCGVVDVTAYTGGHLLFWFNARGATRIYLDNRSSGCGGRRSDCAVPAPSGAVWQVAVNCDLGDENGPEYLHIQSPTPSPSLVGLARSDATGGSIYLLAAATGLPGGPSYEEASLWVSQDGQVNTLLNEAAL